MSLRQIAAIVVALAAVGSLHGADAAQADGIPPPPICPPGTTLRMCHGPAYCEPDRCTSDSDCSGDDVCAELGLCAGSFYCGGGRPPPDASSSGFATTSYARTCGEGCIAGETCTTMRVCVPPGAGGSRTTTYCGCSAAGAGRAPPVVLGALAVVALAVAGRRGDRRGRRRTAGGVRSRRS